MWVVKWRKPENLSSQLLQSLPQWWVQWRDKCREGKVWGWSYSARWRETPCHQCSGSGREDVIILSYVGICRGEEEIVEREGNISRHTKEENLNSKRHTLTLEKWEIPNTCAYISSYNLSLAPPLLPLVTTPAWLRIVWVWKGTCIHYTQCMLIWFLFRAFIELHGRPSPPIFIPYAKDNQLTWTSNSHYSIKMYCLLYRKVGEFLLSNPHLNGSQQYN